MKISKAWLVQIFFSYEWKKENVVPLNKKNNRQFIKIYRFILLLPICSKVFERLILDTMFSHLLENNYLSES